MTTTTTKIKMFAWLVMGILILSFALLNKAWNALPAFLFCAVMVLAYSMDAKSVSGARRMVDAGLAVRNNTRTH